MGVPDKDPTVLAAAGHTRGGGVRTDQRAEAGAHAVLVMYHRELGNRLKTAKAEHTARSDLGGKHLTETQLAVCAAGQQLRHVAGTVPRTVGQRGDGPRAETHRGQPPDGHILAKAHAQSTHHHPAVRAADEQSSAGHVCTEAQHTGRLGRRRNALRLHAERRKLAPGAQVEDVKTRARTAHQRKVRVERMEERGIQRTARRRLGCAWTKTTYHYQLTTFDVRGSGSGSGSGKSGR
mmetsp:Transcript_37614/g.94583  ORF Transcript_37614/g.94583 Transcript_37614/m.94583 type:complete len:236 (+) Transcript_37614:359-1066(+)